MSTPEGTFYLFCESQGPKNSGRTYTHEIHAPLIDPQVRQLARQTVGTFNSVLLAMSWKENQRRFLPNHQRTRRPTARLTKDLSFLPLRGPGLFDPSPSGYKVQLNLKFPVGPQNRDEGDPLFWTKKVRSMQGHRTNFLRVPGASGA
jgi:hypothetical protein